MTFFVMRLPGNPQWHADLVPSGVETCSRGVNNYALNAEEMLRFRIKPALRSIAVGSVAYLE